MEEPLPFTHAGLVAGARQSIPVIFSTFAYGLVFGVLARQAGLSLPEALLMSALVFAGASQLIALGLWATPLPTLAIVLTTFIVNLRYLLMGAALRPWFSRLPARKAYSSVFLMADENWALTMGAFAKDDPDGAFLLGGGVTLFVSWLSATLVGQLAGAFIPDPQRLGLDFAFTAVFLALLVGMWKGASDLLPWLAAAAVAVAAAHWLPGEWYILLGGLAGSLVGALRHAH